MLVLLSVLVLLSSPSRSYGSFARVRIAIIYKSFRLLCICLRYLACVLREPKFRVTRVKNCLKVKHTKKNEEEEINHKQNQKENEKPGFLSPIHSLDLNFNLI